MPNLSLLLSLLLLLLPPSSSSSSPSSPFLSVLPETHHIVDASSRVRVFHGVSAVFKVAPFHPATNYFTWNTSLARHDFELMSHWGFNVLRLGLMWQGGELSRGVYNGTYLNVLQDIVDDAAEFGIVTLLDVHQDVLSPETCGEGVPAYVMDAALRSSLAFPLPLPFAPADFPTTPSGAIDRAACGKHQFFLYYLSDAVSRAFQNIYDNVDTVLDAFADFWATAASVFRDNVNVIGYELINEPWPGNVLRDPKLFEFGYADRVNLEKMYAAAHDKIREVDDDHIIFFEPAVINYGHAGFTQVPGGDAYKNRTALTFHTYCPLTNMTTGDAANLTECKDIFAGIYDRRVADAARLGSGLFMSEFGAHSDTTYNNDEMDIILDLCDEHLISWGGYWMYKGFGDITTQSKSGPVESMFHEDGTPDIGKVKTLARPYPQAIAGTPESIKYSRGEKELVVYWTTRDGVTGDTEIYLGFEVYGAENVNLVVTFDPPGWGTWTFLDNTWASNRIQLTAAKTFDAGTRLGVTLSPRPEAAQPIPIK